MSRTEIENECKRLRDNLINIFTKIQFLQRQLKNFPPPEEKERIIQSLGAFERALDNTRGQMADLGCPRSIPRPAQCTKEFNSPLFGFVMLGGGLCEAWKSTSSLTNASGENVQKYLGFPIKDSEEFFNEQWQSGGVFVYFECGILVHTQVIGKHVVYGAIYQHYRELGGVQGFLGVPISDEHALPGGGRASAFQGGTIYWRSDIGAHEVHGDIHQYWLSHGNVSGFLGYPISDEMPLLKEGVEVGRLSRFEGGVIYWKQSLGAFEIHDELLNDYETKHGGPAGELGFPVSDTIETPSHNGLCSTFENGHRLIWFNSGPYKGVHLVKDLELFVQRFHSKGNDGTLNNAQELYVITDVSWTTGGVTQAIHSETYRGLSAPSGFDVNQVLKKWDPVPMDLVIEVAFAGWDYDWDTTDDILGGVIGTYSIDNLWGMKDEIFDHWNDDFLAVYNLRQPSKPVNLHRMRQEAFWNFVNQGTPRLSREHFAQTFSDVAQSENAIDNFIQGEPLKIIFFEIYRRIAEEGRCFGMCLEAVNAIVGKSLFTEPISRHNPPTDAMWNEISIKHGYQLGNDLIKWFLIMYGFGHTHNPQNAFRQSRDAFRAGDYPILTISSDLLFGSGHVVLPYEWDDSSSPWIIKVANPNRPVSTGEPDNGDQSIIRVWAERNVFEFHFSNNQVWRGGTIGGDRFGGRLLSVPFSMLSARPGTPNWEVAALMSAGILLVLSGNGQTKQITNETGKTFYKTNLIGPPSKWEDINQDLSSRIPNMTIIPFHHGEGKMPELYYLESDVQSISQEITSSGNESPSSYVWGIDSKAMSATISIISNTNNLSDNFSDTISIKSLNSAEQEIAFVSPSSHSIERQCKLSLMRHRFNPAMPEAKRFDLELNISPGQNIRMLLQNFGQEIHIQNTGPQTPAALRISNEAGVTIVSREVSLRQDDITVLGQTI